MPSNWVEMTGRKKSIGNMDEALPGLDANADLAWHFDGKGNAVRVAISPATAQLFTDDQPAGRARAHPAFTWIHCNINSPVLPGLFAAGKISTVISDRLSQSDTRPICIPHDDGLFLNLRGMAAVLDGADSGLIALRFWITRKGIISSSRLQTKAAQETLGEMDRGACPRSVGEFVARFTLRIVDTIEPLVDDLAEAVDGLEIEVVEGSQKLMRRELSEVRRQAIELRRFLYPQRDALSTFLVEHVSFVREEERVKLHEAHDRMTRFIEELEVTRERCAVLHDQIIDNRSERMNKQILLLSVVSALFLPATLIAGLLGMNVAGIPSANHPLAFLAICVATVVLIVGEIALFRWLKII